MLHVARRLHGMIPSVTPVPMPCEKWQNYDRPMAQVPGLRRDRIRGLPGIGALFAGALLVAGMLAGCGPNGSSSALQSTRRACEVVQWSQGYLRAPPSGTYIGVDTARRVQKALAQSHDQTLMADIPALKRAIKLLANATDRAEASEGEAQIQRLVGEPGNYCATVGVTPPT